MPSKLGRILAEEGLTARTAAIPTKLQKALDDAPDLAGWRKLPPVAGWVMDSGGPVLQSISDDSIWVVQYLGKDGMHLYLQMSTGGYNQVSVFLKYNDGTAWHTEQEALGKPSKGVAGLKRFVKEKMPLVEESLKRGALDGDNGQKEVSNISGFTRTEGQGYAGNSASPEIWPREKSGVRLDKTSWVRFESETIVIIVNIRPIVSPWDVKQSGDALYSMSGHTLFKSPKGWLSFSRRGVDDSFYGTEKDIDSILKTQIDKAEKGIERSKSYVQVPVYGFNLSPDTYEAHKKALAAGKPISLAPAGFGVGYQLTKRPLGRDSKPAPAGVAEFFGQTGLYATPFDHD